MLGRANELKAIAEAMKDPRCVLLAVHGEPGIGKTHLLERAPGARPRSPRRAARRHRPRAPRRAAAHPPRATCWSPSPTAACRRRSRARSRRWPATGASRTFPSRPSAATTPTPCSAAPRASSTSTAAASRSTCSRPSTPCTPRSGRSSRSSPRPRAPSPAASPSRTSSSVAAAAADLPEAAALEALDDLVGLIKPTADPRRYRFRHPIVRDAVYAATGPGWRLAAHARAADALKHGSSRERAAHLERCAKAGDDEAIAVLVDAAQDASPDDRRPLVRRRPAARARAPRLAAGPARRGPRGDRPARAGADRAAGGAARSSRATRA